MKRFDVLTYVESKLVRFRRSAGSEVTGVCPNPTCGRYGGFYVNTDTGAYLCNKCDLRGRSVAGLIEVIEGISNQEAWAFIFRQSVEMRRKETAPSLRARFQALRPHALGQEVTLPSYVDDGLPPEFRPCYAHKGGKDVWQLPPYLKSRRVKSATARAWNMGFCRTGRYAGRLVIPVECPNGRSYTARDMVGDQEPKYLNPTGTDFRRLLIGWNVAVLTGDLVLCEGPLDAVKLFQHGIAALSLGGKELHDEQLSMLMDLPSTTAVTIMLDPEEMEAPHKVALRLSVHFQMIYIAKLVEMDGGAIRGLGKDGRPPKLDPGNSTSIEAYGAIDNAERWTGARGARLLAKLGKAKAAAASRWG